MRGGVRIERGIACAARLLCVCVSARAWTRGPTRALFFWAGRFFVPLPIITPAFSFFLSTRPAASAPPLPVFVPPLIPSTLAMRSFALACVFVLLVALLAAQPADGEGGDREGLRRARGLSFAAGRVFPLTMAAWLGPNAHSLLTDAFLS